MITNTWKVTFQEKGSKSPTVSRFTTKKAADEAAKILRRTEQSVKVERLK